MIFRQILFFGFSCHSTECNMAERKYFENCPAGLVIRIFLIYVQIEFVFYCDTTQFSVIFTFQAMTWCLTHAVQFTCMQY